MPDELPDTGAPAATVPASEVDTSASSAATQAQPKDGDATTGGKPETHQYNLEGLQLNGDNAPEVNDLANYLHEKGVAEEHARAVIEWELERDAAIDKQTIEVNNKRSAEVAETLRGEWGDQYDNNRSLIREYLGQLPEKITTALFSTATDEDGALILNDPGVMRFFLSVARGTPPATSQDTADERRQIEALMGNRNSAYWKGPHSQYLQNRYRDLTDQGPGGDVRKPNPAPTGSAEKAKLEAMMRNKNSAYWKGADAERLQARYRELLGG